MFGVKFWYVLSFLQNFSAPLLFFLAFLSTKIAINRSKFTPKSWHFSLKFLYIQSFLVNFSALAWHVSPHPPYLSTSVCPSVSPPQRSFLLLSVLLSALVKIFGVSCMQDFFGYAEFFVQLKIFFIFISVFF